MAHDAVEDVVGELTIRVRDGQHAEILVLHPDAAAAPRDAGHLAHDRGGIGHVQDDGDGERDVEAARREW